MLDHLLVAGDLLPIPVRPSDHADVRTDELVHPKPGFANMLFAFSEVAHDLESCNGSSAIR